MDTHRRYSAPLEPRTPADFADLFAMLEEDLTSAIVADAHDVVRPLALLGVRHLAGQAGLRCLIHGEPGTGKTTAARILAGLLGFPFFRVSMAETAQTTWRGTDLPAHVNAAYQGVRMLPHGIRLMSRAVVLLDDLQVLRLEPFASHGDSTRDQREGLQSSLLSVLSGESISVADGEWTWDSSRCLILCAGHFHGLDGDVDAASLTRWGISRPLADRISAGTIIRLRELPTTDLAEVAMREAHATLSAAFNAFGYALVIAPEAVRHAARTARQRDPEAGPRQVVAAIRRAGDRLLMRLIENGVPHRTVATLTPDDVSN
jgi:hypothetical protein